VFTKDSLDHVLRYSIDVFFRRFVRRYVKVKTPVHVYQAASDTPQFRALFAGAVILSPNKVNHLLDTDLDYAERVASDSLYFNLDSHLTSARGIS
jgi:hypothetical protein